MKGGGHMRLNEKCFNDIMLYIEENQTSVPGIHNAPYTVKRIQLQEIIDHFKATDDKDGFSGEDIWYALTKIEEERLTKIVNMGNSLNPRSTIDDITYRGHMFLARLHAGEFRPDSSAVDA